MRQVVVKSDGVTVGTGSPVTMVKKKKKIRTIFFSIHRTRARTRSCDNFTCKRHIVFVVGFCFSFFFVFMSRVSNLTGFYIQNEK